MAESVGLYELGDVRMVLQTAPPKVVGVPTVIVREDLSGLATKTVIYVDVVLPGEGMDRLAVAGHRDRLPTYTSVTRCASTREGAPPREARYEGILGVYEAAAQWVEYGSVAIWRPERVPRACTSASRRTTRACSSSSRTTVPAPPAMTNPSRFLS